MRNTTLHIVTKIFVNRVIADLQYFIFVSSILIFPYRYFYRYVTNQKTNYKSYFVYASEYIHYIGKNKFIAI
jgi:hypothetical protein